MKKWDVNFVTTGKKKELEWKEKKVKINLKSRVGSTFDLLFERDMPSFIFW